MLLINNCYRKNGTAFLFSRSRKLRFAERCGFELRICYFQEFRRDAVKRMVHSGCRCFAVLHVHGNAQNMTAQWQYAHWLPYRGYNVFAFDYRGYGQSHGKPDDRGVFEDTVAALNYLRGCKDTNNLYVFGQSLGGMLAIAAVGASPQGVSAVFSEAPFYSYTELADDRMPGEAPFFDDTYCACNYVQKISPCPLLLIHGTADKIVPYSHSVRLFELAKEPKRFITVENGEHLDIMTDQYGDTYKDMMDDFFTQAARIK